MFEDLSNTAFETPRKRQRVESIDSPYALARSQLTPSSSLHALEIVGRAQERQAIAQFVGNSTSERKALYITGTPGTGKTLLVKKALESYSGSSMFIDCKTVAASSKTDSHDIWSRLLLSLNNSAPSKPRQRRNTASSSASSAFEQFAAASNNQKDYFIAALDEIDALNLNVITSLFKLSSCSKSKFVLIGIANSLDLTVRNLFEHISSHSSHDCFDSIQVLSFVPYDSASLCEIIRQRLGGGDDCSKFIKPNALEILCRKVTASTGDVRNAFGVVRRALSGVEQQHYSSAASSPDITPSKSNTSTPSLLSPLKQEQKMLPSPSPSPSPSKRTTRKRRREMMAEDNTNSEQDFPAASIAHCLEAFRATKNVFKSSSSNNTPPPPAFNLSTAVDTSGISAAIDGISFDQRLALLAFVVGRQRKQRQRSSSPSKITPKKPTNINMTLTELENVYHDLLKKSDDFKPLSSAEFTDIVISGLETRGVFRMESLTSSSSSKKLGGGRSAQKSAIGCVYSNIQLETVLVNGPSKESNSICSRLLDGEKQRWRRSEREKEWEQGENSNNNDVF